MLFSLGNVSKCILDYISKGIQMRFCGFYFGGSVCKVLLFLLKKDGLTGNAGGIGACVIKKLQKGCFETSRLPGHTGIMKTLLCKITTRRKRKQLVPE